MIEMFLSTHDRSEVVKIPVIPSEIMLSSGSNNISYETIKLGEINLIGLPRLDTVTFESHFPIDEVVYSKNNDIRGWEYVEIINRWRKERIPCRLIISDTPINLLCTIEEFISGIRYGVGDVYYSLTLKEFKFIDLKG